MDTLRLVYYPELVLMRLDVTVFFLTTDVFHAFHRTEEYSRKVRRSQRFLSLRTCGVDVFDLFHIYWKLSNFPSRHNEAPCSEVSP